MRKTIIAAAAAALMLTAALVPASASFAEGHNPVVVPGTPQQKAIGENNAQQLDVDAAGTVYFASVASGSIVKVTAAGAVTRIASFNPETPLTTVVAQRNGSVYFTSTAVPGPIGSRPPVLVMSVPTSGGTPKVVADLGAWQKTHNPDAKNTYGFVGLPKDCADQFLEHREAVRHGSYYYNPSSMIATAGGLYLTDSGRSSVIRVGYDGAISAVAVLPAQSPIFADTPVLFQYTAPNCAYGYKLIPEGAPTGLTQGPDGNLYVTTIPANNSFLNDTFAGGLYRVNPATGATTRIIGKLRGPSGVTSTPSGTMYISELRGSADGNPLGGAGGISVVRVNAQIARPLVDVSFPLAIRFSKDKLYTSDGRLFVTPLTYK